MGGARHRLDQLLVARGLAPTRTRAQAMIAAGIVQVDGSAADRPGRLVGAGATLTLAESYHPWVSRGGLKLAHALDGFGLSPAGLVGLDVGASTGGFTDVLLARGARLVHAVDVGQGQLAARLREDPRVRPLERTDIRRLEPQALQPPAEVVVVDVSFISLLMVLPAALRAAPGARWLVALIKPQFEVGPAALGKGGIVRHSGAAEDAEARVVAWLEAQPGWRPLGVTDSPVRGGDGNRERLIVARRADLAEVGAFRRL